MTPHESYRTARIAHRALAIACALTLAGGLAATAAPSNEDSEHGPLTTTGIQPAPSKARRVLHAPVPTAPDAPQRMRVEGVQTFMPIDPVRVYDTREDKQLHGGKMEAGSAVILPCRNVAGIAKNAAALVVNITATKADHEGFLTVYPTVEQDNTVHPNVSNLNYRPDQNIANTAIVPLSSAGNLSIFNLTSTHYVLDVVGYIPADTGYVPAGPFRVLDSRERKRPMRDGQNTILNFGGGVLPAADARAAVVNVTTTESAGEGFLTTHPSGQPRPNTSVLNYDAHRNQANLTMMGLGDGRANLFTLRNTHMVLDYQGYFSNKSGYHAVNPFRALDTRNGHGKLNASETPVKVAGTNGVPENATAVAVTLTSTEASGEGYFSAWADGQPRTPGSSLNYTANQNMANSIIVPVGKDGRIRVYSHGSSHAIVDVNGYFAQ